MPIDNAAAGYSFRGVMHGKVYHAQFKIGDGPWSTLNDSKGRSQEFASQVQAEKAAEPAAKKALDLMQRTKKRK